MTRRNELDFRLLQLALEAQRHPERSVLRRLALTKLIYGIVNSGKLWYPSKNHFFGTDRDTYDEALQDLLYYICQHIEKYDPERASVIVWVNVLFERRFFKDAIRKNQINHHAAKVSLDDLDNIIASPEETPGLTEIIKECIELDPEGLFKNEHVEKCPQANFQALVKRRISGRSWKEISAEFNIKVPTVSSFYYRCLNKFADKLKEYCSSDAS